MATAIPERPRPDEYAPGFGNYIRLVPDGDVLAFLETQLSEFKNLLDDLSDQLSLLRHPPYTWSIKEVVGHITDCERIFGYRALRLARNDKTPLATFDENAYVQAADFDHVPIRELLREFDLLRQSHLCLFQQIEPQAWLRQGVVTGHPATARAFAFAIAGHAKHHLDILHRRLNQP